jgi:hypothetical protein
MAFSLGFLQGKVQCGVFLPMISEAGLGAGLVLTLGMRKFLFSVFEGICVRLVCFLKCFDLNLDYTLLLNL